MSKFKMKKLVSVFLVLSMVIALLVMPMQATFYEYRGGEHTVDFSNFSGNGTLEAEDVDIHASTYVLDDNSSGVYVRLAFISSAGGNTPLAVEDTDESAVNAYVHVNASDVTETDYIAPGSGFTSHHIVFDIMGNVGEEFFIGTSS